MNKQGSYLLLGFAKHFWCWFLQIALVSACRVVYVHGVEGALGQIEIVDGAGLLLQLNSQRKSNYVSVRGSNTRLGQTAT